MIGIFDSGVGGLTVLDAIRAQLPHEDLVYLGDTARVPYGNRTPQTIVRYATSCARQLVKRDVKAIVIACNTASAHALNALNEAFDVPVFGVIEPAAQMAMQMTQKGSIGIIGTRATIASRAYEHAILRSAPDMKVCGHACPLFVPLVEEAWSKTEVARLVVKQYLSELIAKAGSDVPDTLILGCTHYPVLKPMISEVLSVLGVDMQLCDCAQATASYLSHELSNRHLLDTKTALGRVEYLVTDDPDQFAEVGRSFMAEAPQLVRHIDIV
jgi:glutamate racemase